MKTLSIIKPQQLVLENNEKPVLKEGYAIIEIKYCGICGSDVTAFKGTNPTMKYPIHGLGHEGVGTVSEVGENDFGIKVGDRVALEPYIPDFTCNMCKMGRYNNCEHLSVAGVHTDGMMTEYFSHPLQLIHKLPDSLSFEEAALAEPLTIGIHGAIRAKVKENDNVVIFGAGTIGLMAAFSCLSKGATPIIVDINDSRLKVTEEKLKFKYTINSANDNVVEKIKEITGGELCDAMIECTGSQAVLSNMHEYVRNGSTIALVGWPKGLTEINQTRIMQKELDICPSRNSCNNFREAINLINSGNENIKKMITKTIELEDVEDTIVDMIQNPGDYLKVVVRI